MTPDSAIAAIGTQADGDYILRPVEHAEMYQDAAPALAALLRRADVGTQAESYSTQNDKAVEAQNTYKWWMRLTNGAVLATSILSALSMAAAILSKDPQFGTWIAADATRWFAAGALVTSAVGAFGIFTIRQAGQLRDWMRYRAMAETRRVGYFDTLTQRAAEAGEVAALQLSLEYFRRYQLEVQRNFYRMRASDHDASARTSVLIGGIGAAIAALASSAGTFGSDPWVPALGTLTVVGAALGAFGAARELMHQDQRNKERYERTDHALERLQSKLDEVRAAAAAGNDQAVLDFVASVNEQISLEHRQWLEGGESANAALTKLEASLAATKKAANPGG